jgi:hypothetical protein
MRRYSELGVWILALVLLATMNPAIESQSVCFFKFIGIPFCPGCGLGHSISFLFHGELRSSLSAHPLGIFALIVILFRIYKLSSLHIFSNSKPTDYAVRQQF